MKKKFVEGLKWIEEDEMLNLIAIAQSSPGPIAVNTSVLIGYNVAGLVGALVYGLLFCANDYPFSNFDVLQCIYKNAVISAIMKGMQAGVAAVITDAVLNLGSNVARKRN